MQNPSGKDSLRRKVLRLLERAGDGNIQAWQELKTLGGEYEGFADHLLRTRGDIGAVTANALIDAVAGPDCISREGLQKTLKELSHSLGSNDGHPLENLVIDLIVCCWIQTHHATLSHTKNWMRLEPQQEELMQRHQDRAQRRLLRAVKTLAQVRQLLGLNIQVNIAEKQVNVQGID